MTMETFRKRIEANSIEVNPHDMRGCGCFVDYNEDDED